MAKKAPKPPKAPVAISASPKTLVEEIWSGLVGRGFRPFSLWFSAILLPLCILCYVQQFQVQVVSFASLVLFWTIPMEQVCYFLVGVNNIRECLADVIPLVPGLLPYLPNITKLVILNIFKIAPAAGPLAPHLKYLLKYPKFVNDAFPLLLPKMDLMMKYDMIGLMAPSLPHMTETHYNKLALILPDLMKEMELLGPHFHVIAPYLPEIALRAEVLFPVVKLLIPHIDACQRHMWWLIPFADVPGFQEFMVHLDVLAENIDEFAVYGPDLLPFISKIRPYVGILVNNLDTLLPMIGETEDHMDPLVYWLSAGMPLADKLGLLRRSFLLKMSLPLLTLLPNVPENQRTIVIPQDLRAKQAHLHGVHLVRARKNPHSHVTYYLLAINGDCVGEFRYRILLKLHEQVVKKKVKRNIPVFPEKAWSVEVESRRKQLETYLQFVFGSPQVMNSNEFKSFVKKELPESMHAPLLNYAS